jgi:hypothetical protein
LVWNVIFGFPEFFYIQFYIQVAIGHLSSFLLQTIPAFWPNLAQICSTPIRKVVLSGDCDQLGMLRFSQAKKVVWMEQSPRVVSGNQWQQSLTMCLNEILYTIFMVK